MRQQPRKWATTTLEYLHLHLHRHPEDLWALVTQMLASASHLAVLIHWGSQGLWTDAALLILAPWLTTSIAQWVVQAPHVQDIDVYGALWLVQLHGLYEGYHSVAVWPSGTKHPFLLVQSFLVAVMQLFPVAVALLTRVLHVLHEDKDDPKHEIPLLSSVCALSLLAYAAAAAKIGPPLHSSALEWGSCGCLYSLVQVHVVWAARVSFRLWEATATVLCYALLIHVFGWLAVLFWLAHLLVVALLLAYLHRPLLLKQLVMPSLLDSLMLHHSMACARPDVNLPMHSRQSLSQPQQTGRRSRHQHIVSFSSSSTASASSLIPNRSLYTSNSGPVIASRGHAINDADENSAHDSDSETNQLLPRNHGPRSNRESSEQEAPAEDNLSPYDSKALFLSLINKTAFWLMSLISVATVADPEVSLVNIPMLVMILISYYASAYSLVLVYKMS